MVQCKHVSTIYDEGYCTDILYIHSYHADVMKPKNWNWIKWYICKLLLSYIALELVHLSGHFQGLGQNWNCDSCDINLPWVHADGNGLCRTYDARIYTNTCAYYSYICLLSICWRHREFLGESPWVSSFHLCEKREACTIVEHCLTPDHLWACRHTNCSANPERVFPILWIIVVWCFLFWWHKCMYLHHRESYVLT